MQQNARKKELKSINEFRKLAGYAPLNERKRKCLRCDKSFKSGGNHNRLCDACKSNTRYAYCQIPLATVHTNIKGDVI